MSLIQRLFACQPHDRIREAQGPALRRCLGLGGLVAVGLGTMLGGIFTTIGAGALHAGPGVIFSFILSGVACFFVSICYAELASMVPIAGSAYTYAYATLGEVIAWIIGWDLLLEYGISVAPAAASWSGYVQAMLLNFGLKLPPWAQVAHVQFAGHGIDMAHSQVDVMAAGVVLALAVLLAIGIKESASTNGALVVIQIAAILVFVGGLVGAIHPGNFQPMFPSGFHGVLTGASLVFFAYIGFDTVTVASEEARRPTRDVPLAILASLAIGAVLYVAIAWVTVGVVPWQHISENAGMNDAVVRAGNNRVLAAILFAGAFSGTTTIMLTSLLGQIRIFYVMARDRMLPAFVSRVNPRTHTPVVTTLVTGAVVAVLAAGVPLDVLLALVNIGTLSAFAIVCLGVLMLRFTRPDAPRPFRAPFGPAVAITGAILCVGLMAGLSGATWIRFVVWFACGIAVYAFYGFRTSRLRQGGGQIAWRRSAEPSAPEGEPSAS